MSVAAFHTVTMCVKNDDAVLVVTDIAVFLVAQLGPALTAAAAAAAAAAAHDVANMAALVVPAAVDSAGAGMAELAIEAVALLVLRAVNTAATAGMALNNKEATSDAEKWPQFLFLIKIRTETVSSTRLLDFRLFLLHKIFNSSMQTESIH